MLRRLPEIICIIGLAIFFLCFISVIYGAGWFLFKVTFAVFSMG